jgi:hypothetical protein
VLRSRHLLACLPILVGIALRFVADVRAQPAPVAPANPPPAGAVADAGVSDAAPATDAAAAVAPVAPSADAGVPETTPLAPDAPPASATEEPAATGSGLFERSISEGPTPAAPGETEARSVDITGYVRGDLFVGKVPKFAQPELKAGYGELALRFATKKERYGDAVAEARLRYGQQGAERALFLDLREAYVNAYVGPLDVRLGQQIIVWGRADAFNPTNNITPFDLRVRSPVEDDRRLGNVGVRTFLNFQPVRLEGVWMPIYQATELPTGVVPEVVVFNEPNFPPAQFDKGLGAARLHLELSAFEASVSYLHGYSPLAGFVLSSFTTGVDGEVRVIRTAHNHSVYGFDFSTAFGELLALRGEAAYRRPVDYENRAYAPNPDIQYVLGVDRAFGSVSVIAQYAGRYVFDHEVAPAPTDPITPTGLARFPNPPGDSLEPIIRTAIEREIARRNQILFQQRAEIQHLATVRVEWLTMHDDLSLSALGMMNFTTKEVLFFPKLAYKMSDTLSTSVGAEIYAGPEDTLFGLIDAPLSAGYAELRASF